MSVFHEFVKPGHWEQNKLAERLSEFHVSREKLENVLVKFDEECDRGLRYSEPRQDLLMITTYVRTMPNGKEEGDFFTLDLGGTNFRVMLFQIHNGIIQWSSEVYPLSQEIMTGTSDHLFDFLADCLAKFAIKKRGKDNTDLGTIGFTFSFPVVQFGLTSGFLKHWTKGFNVEGVCGQDVSELLMNAIIKRKEIIVESIAIINDTTGTMVSCGFDDQEVMIGLILGTGTNACYMEKVANAKDMEKEKDLSGGVIINMEWGGFGTYSNALDSVITTYDKLVDANSMNPEKQIFEKLISGMYLGELVRQCVLQLIKDRVLFQGITSSEIMVEGSFSTAHVSEFCSGQAKLAVDILTSLGYPKATLFDCTAIQEICSVVSLRAARLAAAGLVAIIRRLGKSSLTVAIDGSLYKKHPTFKRYMQRTIQEMLPWSNIKLRLTEDGSGRGAALVAAAMKRN